MKRILFLLFTLHFSLFTFQAQAQNEDEFRYMRSSLCMMMVENPLSEFKPEIKEIFTEMDMPNRFNDHRFGKIRVLKFPNRDNMELNLKTFAKENQLAKRLVSKWFGHNKATDPFNTDMLRERGIYNATQIDIEEAMGTMRGKAMLEDMGENLIGQTFWVVTDLEYKKHATTGITGALNGAATLMDGVNKISTQGLNGLDNLLEKSEGSLSAYMDTLTNTVDFKSYQMKATSYLFRLKWDEDIAAVFYKNYYTTDPSDEAKLNLYKDAEDLFTLEYVGQVTTKSTKSSAFGVRTVKQLITKACVRALDENLAKLQHEFADFRIKTPLVSVAPLKAYIGMKEDVTEKSQYEVLIPELDERGVTVYTRVGVIKPMKGRIWDNRYMAEEENTNEASFGATFFEKVSGKDFAPGMLIREIK